MARCAFPCRQIRTVFFYRGSGTSFARYPLNTVKKKKYKSRRICPSPTLGFFLKPFRIPQSPVPVRSKMGSFAAGQSSNCSESEPVIIPGFPDLKAEEDHSCRTAR